MYKIDNTYTHKQRERERERERVIRHIRGAIVEICESLSSFQSASGRNRRRIPHYSRSPRSGNEARMDSGADGYSSCDYRVDRERMGATAKSATGENSGGRGWGETRR